MADRTTIENMVLETLKTIPTTFPLNDVIIDKINSGDVKLNTFDNKDYTLKTSRENALLYFYLCSKGIVELISEKSPYEIIYSKIFNKDIPTVKFNLEDSKYYDSNVEIKDVEKYILLNSPIICVNVEKDHYFNSYNVYLFVQGDVIYCLQPQNTNLILNYKNFKTLNIVLDNSVLVQTGNNLILELYHLLWFYIVCGTKLYQISKIDLILHQIFKDTLVIFILNFCLSLIKALLESEETLLKYFESFQKYYYIFYMRGLDPKNEININTMLLNYKENHNNIPYVPEYRNIVELKSKIFYCDFIKEFSKQMNIKRHILNSCDIWEEQLKNQVSSEYRIINNELFRLLDIKNWVNNNDEKDNTKFLFRSYEFGDPRLGEYTKEISLMMKECFNSIDYKAETESKWLLMFDNYKVIGFMTIDKLNAIWNVCVKKEYRSKGIAAKLMKETIDYACKKGGNPPTLLVDKNGVNYNKLIVLYKSFGFEILESRDPNITDILFRGMKPELFTYMFFDCSKPFGHPFMKTEEKDVNYSDWFSSKKYFKHMFLIKSYLGNNPIMKNYAKDINVMLGECFGQGNYEIESHSNWVLVFAGKKEEEKTMELAALIMVDPYNVIWNVCVKKEYRRHGIAQELLTRAIKFICFDGQTFYPRLVVDKNGPNYNNLIKMYSSFGFEEVNPKTLNKEELRMFYRNFDSKDSTFMIFKCEKKH